MLTLSYIHLHVYICIYIRSYIYIQRLRHALVGLWTLFALESSQRTQDSGCQFAGDTKLGGRADPPEGPAAAQGSGTGWRNGLRRVLKFTGGTHSPATGEERAQAGVRAGDGCLGSSIAEKDLGDPEDTTDREPASELLGVLSLLELGQKLLL